MYRRYAFLVVLHLAFAVFETSALRGKRDTKAPLIHAPEDERVADEYIVKLKEDLTEEEMIEIEEYLKKIAEEKGIEIEYHRTLTNIMKGFTAKIPADALEIIRWFEEVEYVEEDEEFSLDSAIPWGLDRIDQETLPLDSKYNPPLGDGSGIHVFVVDSGISYSHNEFEGRAEPFVDLVGDNRDGEDCNSHGTHVAATIGGVTVGVAPGVTLHSVRLFDCNGRGGTVSRIVSGLDLITNSSMTPGVVSMSITGGYSVAVNDAVGRMLAAGYITVAAAGNTHVDACLKSPASAPTAITVGATADNDSLAYISNFGSCLNILAPGVQIVSAHHSGTNAYSTKTGTSMACPHVTGVVAKLLEFDTSLTRDEVLAELVDFASENLVNLSVVPEEFRSDTPNLLLRIPSGQKTWRDDLRCGAGYLNKYNNSAECDPYSDYPCCSDDQWCSNQVSDCTCDTCADYRPDLCTNSCWWFSDGECDDGGPGATYSGCDYGTDCDDCGPRRP